MKIGNLRWYFFFICRILFGITILLNISLVFSQPIKINDFKNQQLNINLPILSYLESTYKFLGKNNLEIAYIKDSPSLKYYSIQQKFNGLPIENATVKVAIDSSNTIRFIDGTLYDTHMWYLNTEKINLIAFSKYIQQVYAMDSILTSFAIIHVDKNFAPKIYLEFNEINIKSGDFITYLFNLQYELINIDKHRTYFSIDSLVIGMVFLPDPLTTSSAIYGGDFVDNNDADNSFINDQRIPVSFNATFINDTFYLKNTNFILKDLSDPYTEQTYSLLPSFDFLRNDDRFEDVNTFYHLLNFSNYVQTIGYYDLQNFILEVDAHAINGADQSFFTSGSSPNLQFGEGGVDDAEDADVIIHEYTHALSFNASPGSNIGFERRAVDEGYGDYFAVSYSRMFSYFNWQNVFSWDGHNEFWSGRNANTDNHYPEDASLSDYYVSSLIWSGALMDIFDAVGKEVTDKIVLESLYGSFVNMSLYDAAKIFLNAEHTLYGETYYSTIFTILDSRGLIFHDAIVEIINKNVFKNSIGFSFNNEPLIIEFPETTMYTLEVFDLAGQLIFSQHGSSKIILLKPSSILANFGVIKVNTNRAIYTSKFIKFE